MTPKQQELAEIERWCQDHDKMNSVVDLPNTVEYGRYHFLLTELKDAWKQCEEGLQSEAEVRIDLMTANNKLEIARKAIGAVKELNTDSINAIFRGFTTDAEAQLRTSQSLLRVALKELSDE